MLLPLTVFLTGIIGAFFAKVALNPVDRIIKDIHQITAQNLKKRTSIPDTNDEISRLADTFNDMLARLEYAFFSQRKFIEDLAHELKTPLAILKGEIEVALKKIRSKEEYENILKSSIEEINRISSIVENLLIFARFENDTVMLETKTLDITILLKSVVDDIKILAMQKNIKMSIKEQEKIVISGDADKLKRLFLNILDNAIKYNPQGGKVNISITKKNDSVHIRVSDTGIGIPEKDICHIFDRFYQVDKSGHQSGFGLGLSIARSIAEAHKGKIEAESTLNHGTTFIISFPLEIC
ncbi:MAG: ATP-binding protein [Candidatus Omnitrophica bacterium]|nr:ATP-binding protein [Candidatus Omnitrophota bacterium]